MEEIMLGYETITVKSEHEKAVLTGAMELLDELTSRLIGRLRESAVTEGFAAENMWQELCIQAADPDVPFWKIYGDLLYDLIRSELAGCNSGDVRSLWFLTDAFLDLYDDRGGDVGIDPDSGVIADNFRETDVVHMIYEELVARSCGPDR